MQVKKRRNKGKKIMYQLSRRCYRIAPEKKEKKHIRVKFSIGFSHRQIPREFESE